MIFVKESTSLCKLMIAKTKLPISKKFYSIFLAGNVMYNPFKVFYDQQLTTGQSPLTTNTRYLASGLTPFGVIFQSSIYFYCHALVLERKQWMLKTCNG